MELSTQPDRPRRWRRAAAAIALVALVGWAATRQHDQNSFVATGTPRATPAAGALTPLSGDEFEGVLVGLHGRPVIVNIWASWCAPCRTETPLLERTWKSGAGDVEIIGVASKDSAGPARQFMDEFDVTFPNIFDESGDIRKRLGLRGFPTTYVFDADGNLQATIVGGLTEPRLASILQDLQP